MSASKGCPIGFVRGILASPWTSVIASISVKLGFAACFTAFFFFGFDYVTDEHFEVRFVKAYETWGIVYPRGGKSLDAYDTMNIAFLWTSMLVAFFLALISRALPSPAEVPKIWRRVTSKLSSFLRFQLPPRRFFVWWCGGMSVIDASVLLLYLAFNIWYFASYVSDYAKELDAFAAAGVAFPEPHARIMLERVALVFGILAWPSLWLLFLPIPHNSLIQAALGLSYAEGIRYHRWFGHGTMLFLTLHGTLYYLYWIMKGGFWALFFDWGGESSINYFAGTLAMLFGWVLWATSIEWCRRRFFEVFYRCHLICFVGFTLFAYMHYFWSWSYFLPGALLYAGDLVMRSGQLTQVTAASAAPSAPGNDASDPSVVTLDIQASKDFKACPLHDIYLLFPSVSRWQWHPFTLASIDQAAGGPTLRIHIKNYGQWTQRLFSQLAANKHLPVRVRGPVGEDAYVKSWRHFHTMLFVAGGVGVSPLLCILKAMINWKREAQEGAQQSFPKVVLVWSCRNRQEFEMLDEEVLKATDYWLTIKLFTTGNAVDDAAASESPPAIDANPQEPGSSNKSLGSDSSEDMKLQATESTPFAFANASPFYVTAVHRLQPESLNLWHTAAIMTLTFVGGFFATYLGSTEFGERSIYYSTAGIDDVSAYSWISGTVWFFTQFIMSLGFPFALGILPMLVYRHWRIRKTAGLTPADFSDARASFAPCVSAGKFVTSSNGEASTEILAGRPDIHGELVAAAEAAAKTAASEGLPAEVGVYVAGPKSMTNSVMLAVAEANGFCSSSLGAKFVLHKAAWEL